MIGPIWPPAVSVFGRDAKERPAVCGSCGADVEQTVCINYCSAARAGAHPFQDRRVFLCWSCLVAAVRELAIASVAAQSASRVLPAPGS